MSTILAILACLAGLLLLALAWLSGHRTLIPAVVKPLWFWIPGLFLLISSPVVALTPSVIQWNTCSDACTLDDEEVGQLFDRCVRGSTATVAKDASNAEELNQAQLDALIEENMPAIEAQCRQTVTNSCTTTCFNDWWDPQTAALAEAPE